MSLAHAVAQLRHLYAQMIKERVKSPVHAAIGILGPAIEEIERFQMSLPPSSTAPRADPATIPLCVVTAPRVAQERMGDVAEAAATGWKLTGNVVEPLPAPAPRQPSDPATTAKEPRCTHRHPDGRDAREAGTFYISWRCTLCGGSDLDEESTPAPQPRPQPRPAHLPSCSPAGCAPRCPWRGEEVHGG